MRKNNQRERVYFNERATLGAIMLNGDAFYDVVPIVGTTGEMFTDKTHRAVWIAMVKLAKNNRPMDLMAIIDLCREESPSTIAELDMAVKTSSSAAYHAGLVRDFHAAQKFLAHSKRVVRLFEEDALDRDVMEAKIAEINSLLKTSEKGSIESISQIIPRVMASIEKNLRDPHGTPVIHTGIPKLDKMLDCLRPDTLNIIGARPSVGKSALAANIALSAAREGHPVLFFSLEMGGDSIVKRLMSIDQGVPYKTLAGEFAEHVQRKRIDDAKENFTKLKLFIDDSGSLDINRFKSESRRFASQHSGMPLIILDYLQLVKLNQDEKDVKRYAQIGDFTRDAKLLSRELHCPVILLCQLSRYADQEDDPSRCMTHLRESGNIEQDADVVIILLKKLDEGLAKLTQKEVATELAGNVMNCGVIKNRDGETGPCALYFEKPTQRIVSLHDFLAGELGREYKPPVIPYEDPFPEDSYSEEDDTPF